MPTPSVAAATEAIITATGPSSAQVSRRSA
jgi:hypothetical protein